MMVMLYEREMVRSGGRDGPCPDSADEVIRQKTGSNLARGNYICAILEHCGLVKYEMLAHKKVIVRS